MTQEKKEYKRGAHIMKIVQLGLQDKVYNAMKKEDFSLKKLSEDFKKEGHDITVQSIAKFIKKTKQAQRELISKDLKASHQIQKLTMDYTKELNSILKEVEEVKNNVKKEKDYKAYDRMIGRLMQGIELIAKLTGDIKQKGSIDINIIYNEINTDVEKKMKSINNDIFDGKVIDIDADIIEEDIKLAKEMVD